MQGTEGNPVTYGAYGEGENPAFSGSVDVSREENWEAVPGSPNVWRCLGPLTTQVCNFVFNNAFGGALKWEREALSARGDWWDSAFGQYEVRPEEHTVLLYCEENPAKAFQHIECVLVVHRNLAVMGHDIVLENLTFKNNGVHGFSGTNGKNVIVRNCRFEFIGGCVWSKELRIRFGNGVEFWNSAENAVIEHCVFYDIFDSGVTHQGEHGKCLPAKNLVFRNNLFVRCGMAAYEQRDVLPLDAQFVGNVCADAGRGFSHYGTELPRSSEIWPQPMRHRKMWCPIRSRWGTTSSCGASTAPRKTPASPFAKTCSWTLPTARPSIPSLTAPRKRRRTSTRTPIACASARF